ncbi:M48 family metalloprotease [Tepidiphilus sp. J10]|uniref:M48 family metalloprotease n=1 Tax=Tepidiphilus sp. J10 TaxID=2502185 RepID=UPI001C8F6D74|nr:M48 family metalloprotease [Tepidiphilus sp. J10]
MIADSVLLPQEDKMHETAWMALDALGRRPMTRRQALALLGASLTAPLFSGCATSPVTGETIFVGMSEAQEIALDRQLAPQQFSQDLGPIPQASVNAYVSEVGARVHAVSHRPSLPYSYRGLNANYLNAYTFPAGSVGVTRALLVRLDDEAQLAAVLGHEIGHVNARHSAQQQAKAMLAQVALTALDAATSRSDWGQWLVQGGAVGASALLASYSREQEREADYLGQRYMVLAGYPASAMVRLHQILLEEEKTRPGLIETMFSTHPLTQERIQRAQWLAETEFADGERFPVQRERFMDRTAPLRALRPTIERCGRGEEAMGAKKLAEAEQHFREAVKLTPDDYAANVRLAQTLLARGRLDEARAYAEHARSVYPQEAQAHKVLAATALQQRRFDEALVALETYDRLLPGDTGITFLRGVSLEGLGRRQEAARLYADVLQRTGGRGQAAAYARQRLRQWGYVR